MEDWSGRYILEETDERGGRTVGAFERASGLTEEGRVGPWESRVASSVADTFTMPDRERQSQCDPVARKFESAASSLDPHRCNSFSYCLGSGAGRAGAGESTILSLIMPHGAMVTSSSAAVG
ncbi:hypothetical protein PsorP6_014652 [Peronosclerospora sorghi]|uniref:Uncharacterized protein n=1 Tax=Peronosclerospora sorghi TaxID=230839 RepID=A0ACC0VS20_9STRA|nr:hypothetical protein PsorP6_014652 [Peronosclerospora sorghi]